MTLNDYYHAYNDAIAEHNHIFENTPRPYKGEARERHEAHLKRAHARLMEASWEYQRAQARVAIRFGDIDLDCGDA